MSSPIFTPLTQAVQWVDPTQNTDGSPVTTGEITGYSLGVRRDGSAVPAAHGGTYPQSVTVTGATATSESAADLISALSLSPGNYWFSVATQGPTNSDWATEAAFSVPAPLPVPQPPSGLSVA